MAQNIPHRWHNCFHLALTQQNIAEGTEDKDLQASPPKCSRFEDYLFTRRQFSKIAHLCKQLFMTHDSILLLDDI